MSQRPRRLRLRSMAERGYWTLREYLDSAATDSASAELVSGLEKHSGEPLRALYFGSGHHRAYLLDLIYREHRVDSRQEGLKAWNARRPIERLGRDVDLVLADLPWPYQKLLAGGGFMASPAWVCQRMALAERWEDVFGPLRRSARREDLRGIRKHGFEAGLVNGEPAVRRFYEELYVPHLKRRFGEAAYVEPPWKIRYCVEHGALMEIRRDGRLVAAQVLWDDRGSLQFLWAGIVDEEFAAQSRGVFPALFYFGILRAFENGCTEVDYCGSRPVLTDGTFRLKRRWGGRVFDGWSLDTLMIRPNNFGQANRAFFANHPLIVRTTQGLVGKVMLDNGPVGPEAVASAAHLYATAGVDALRLDSLQPPQPGAWDAVRSTAAIELVDLSGEPRPEIAYCRS